MRPAYRRLLLLALLSLMVSPLAGWTAAGGWYCATGTQCEPAAAVACCCEDAVAPDDCCAQGGSGYSAAACGCYYDAHLVDASLQFAKWRGAGFHALPQPRPFLVSATVLTRFLPLPHDAHGPPGIAVFSRVIRGPPAV
jgi:hypothetical protein